jgi:hypothetical protein
LSCEASVAILFKLTNIFKERKTTDQYPS